MCVFLRVYWIITFNDFYGITKSRGVGLQFLKTLKVMGYSIKTFLQSIKVKVYSITTFIDSLKVMGYWIKTLKKPIKVKVYSITTFIDSLKAKVYGYSKNFYRLSKSKSISMLKKSLRLSKTLKKPIKVKLYSITTFITL